MVDVPVRISSPQFVGRVAELERLVGGFKSAAADERATAVMLGGEAGVGKTRLVAELAARVQAADGLVLVGSCLDLTNASLPFGPVVQALRSLQRSLDPVTLEAVIGPAAHVVERLVPDAPSEVVDGITSTGALFEQLLGVFERLGERKATLLVLEDLHWADHSTRDFVTYLARNLQNARVMLLGTYRSDDLNRRHPLRNVLAELDRSGAAQRLELERFDREELSEMIASILSCEPPTDLVEMVFARSEGNAFFAEELIAARGTTDQIPESLRDIMLARMDALSEGSQRLLRVVAVIGRRADHRLVDALSDASSEDDLSSGLREATEHQVLVVEHDCVAYRFRHALVREAVYDDLLPGERVRLHARLAEVLTENPAWCDGGPEALAGELAAHWHAAHDSRRALKALLDAARDAGRMYAYPEALSHVEQALELWPQVSEPEALCATRHVDVVQHAAVLAELAGRVDRATEFIAAAAAEVDTDHDPVTAGLLHERWARYLRTMGSPTSEVLDHVDRAIRLVPPSEGAARARVLATYGQQLMLAGRSADAVEPCEQAIELAEQLGETAIASHARNTLGISHAALGDLDGGLSCLRQARDEAVEARAWEDVARADMNQASALTSAARHEEALAVSLRGLEEARRHGLSQQVGSCMLPGVCESQWALGRWDDVEESLREIEATDHPGTDAWFVAYLQAAWHGARGDFPTAREHLGRLRELLGSEIDVPWQVGLANLSIVIALWEGDLATAVEWARNGMDTKFDGALCADTEASTALPLNAMAAAARLAASARPSDLEARSKAQDLAREFAGRFNEWVDDELWGPARPGDLAPIARQVAAELAIVEGAGDAADWAALAAEWDGYAILPRVAYARWREAELRLTSGDRTGATDAARAAYEIADALGWQWVRSGVADLVRRGRLDIEVGAHPIPEAAEELGLTAREVEVLGLVAEGRTNRQIAESLFISTKTASAHVSNLLTKLGVTNRAEAGAAARRLGLD